MALFVDDFVLYVSFPKDTLSRQRVADVSKCVLVLGMKGKIEERKEEYCVWPADITTLSDKIVPTSQFTRRFVGFYKR